MSDGSSGRILGTIAGAALAYFTGGASYVALGATLGGAVGSLADPKQKVEGPRLDDLKVQFSTYGVGIPRIYGTERVGGNVIGSTDKLEIPWVTSSGKGGGGVENTSYTYYVWMRLLLCETPRDGSTVNIVKFFQDGKLIWDASSGIPIGSALASAENLYASFVLYQGHGDQLPDAEEESFTGGPGSVSAYRGVVSVWMRAIECPGGRVPQFSFVLSTGATVGPVTESFVDVPSTSPSNDETYAVIRKDAIWNGDLLGLWYDGTLRLKVTYGGVGFASVQRTIPLPISVNGAVPIPLSGDGDPCMLLPYDGNLMRIRLDTGETSLIVPSLLAPPGIWHGYSWPRSAGYDSLSDKYAMIAGDGTNPQNVYIIGNGAVIVGGTIPGVDINGNGLGACTMVNNVAYVLSQGSGRLIISSFSGDDGSFISSTIGPVYQDVSTSIIWAALHPGDGGLYAWARDTGPVGSLLLEKLWFIDISIPGAAVFTELGNDVTPVYGDKISRLPTTIYASKQYAIVGPGRDQGRGLHNYSVWLRNTVTTTSYKVKDIIAAECELAGVTTYDVSGIPDSDTVIGYKLANPASARANIEPLLTLIGGYVVDEDGVTKFRKFSDITSVASVSFDELGQAEGDASGEAMPLNRTQEIDLPRSVTTSYIDPSNDYQTASEPFVRQVTDATEDRQIQLPVCVISSQAQKVSQMVANDAWRRQNSRSTTVSRKFAFVSPGDGVTVEYPRGTFKLWLVLSTNDTGALCEWSLCPGDASIFTQTAVGATGYVSQEVVPLVAPTRAVPLDMAIVRDQDNNAGMYFALDSYAAQPASGELLIGDDDTNLQSRGAVSASAPIGFAETVLGDWQRALVDEANLVTVSLGDDVFNSVTRDVLLAGGGEYWAYGAPGRWEIGASASASSLGGGRFILTRHMRGLFGTERCAGLHVAGDTFVLLRQVGMLRPDSGVGAIGQSKVFRAVSKGRSRDSVSSEAFVNTGEGLTPLAPVNLRRTDANDYTVDRRSRLAMNNLTGAVPLGEATEHYSWEFYSSGTFATLVGTVLTNVPTVTATQQTAIGITPSAISFIKVRQISDSIGPGRELQATA